MENIFYDLAKVYFSLKQRVVVKTLIIDLDVSGLLLEAAIALFVVSAAVYFWATSSSRHAFVHNASFVKFQSSRCSAKILFVFSFVSHDCLLNL